MKKTITLVASLIAMLLSAAPVVAETYYIPMPVYRTGPYAAGGTGYFGGIIDYFTLLNERDGGIGGVKLVWDECETEYNRTKGIECYHRQKKSELGDALYFDPLSVGISSSLIEQGRKDKISIISVNHGRTETERGDVFPYQFPLGTNAYDFAYATVKHMGEQMGGGIDKLKGETIVTLFHGSPYGREANEFLTGLGEQHGFKHVPIEVPHPGNEQGSQWLKIRRMKPAFVFLRGWGVMNPVAMQTAVRNGYPVSKLIGNEWSNSDEDVIPAGKAAHGYQAVTVHRAGDDFPAADAIRELYAQGKGDLEDKSRIGSVYWNLGIWAAVMSAEAIRVAQKRFGKKLTSAQVRWGFENITLTEGRLTEMGLGDIVPAIKVTCLDHAAVHTARFQQWDAGKRKWELISGWIEGRSDYSQNVVDTNADKYAEEHPEFPKRNCSDPKDRDDFDV